MPAKKRFYKQILLLIGTLIITLSIIITINTFVSHVKENEIAIADNNLLVASDNGAALIKMTFDHYMTILQTTALNIEQHENLRSNDVLATLDKISIANKKQHFSIDFPDGSTLSPKNCIHDTNYSDYMISIENNECIISDVTFSQTKNLPIVNFWAPLHNADGVPVAALRLTLTTLELTESINLSLFNSEGYYHLIDQNGHYVAASQSTNALLMDDNFFDAIAKLDYEPSYSAAQIVASFNEGTRGYSKYAIDGNERYAYCQPVGINNWVLMTIVPKSVVVDQQRQNIYYATVMAIQVCLILLIIFIYIFYQQRKARLIAELKDQCFRALAQQTGNVIFEWDFAQNKINTLTDFRALFDREAATQHASATEALAAHAIHSDDTLTFQSIFTTVSQGINVDNIRFRVRHNNGHFHWCSLSAVVINDPHGVPYKAIGTLEDIQEVVSKEAILKQRSEKDQLTSLYNKATTEALIIQSLDEQKNSLSRCALLIIDIDNFKNINDRLGHQFGDTVLTELATLLSTQFRNSDIVGRIGGDEFFVFVKNCTVDAPIINKAQELCHLFEKIYTQGQTSCKISASIGISFYPEHGTDFESLYKHADIALYLTKARGKNGYTIYDGTASHDYVSNRTAIDSPRHTG